MLKKNITYKDFNGNQVTDLFTFHITPAALVEMEAETPGGMGALLQTMQETQDGAVIMNVFKTMLKRSVGKISDNGKQFIQNDEILNEFIQSNAYSALLIELMQDEDLAATFFNSIMPEDLKEIVASLPNTEGTTYAPVPVEEPKKVLTRAEVIELTREELNAKLLDGWRIA